MWKWKQFLLVVAFIVVLGVSIVGCAKQQFVKQQFNEAVAAASGSRTLPAKVDILLVPDNTGSVNVAFTQLQSELANFVSNLQSQAWDYHIASSPIDYQGSYYPINQVLVNPTYNTTTASDGTALNPTSDVVPANYAVTSVNNFQMMSLPTNAGNGDNTYINTYNTLSHAKSGGSNFLRPDAPLAIVVITNGYDGTVTDSTGTFLSNGTQNLQNYANELSALKGSSSMVRFYPIAAYRYNIGQSSNYCLTPGGQSFIGTSYFAMNTYLPGLGQYDSSGNETEDFCNMTSLTNVFNDIQANLQSMVQDYVYSAIVLSDEPVINSDFQVTKNGNVLPQDPNNGWEYLGYESNFCTVTSVINPSTGVESPITPCLFQQTGYVIQLNGSAQMWGGDVPNVVTDHP